MESRENPRTIRVDHVQEDTPEPSSSAMPWPADIRDPLSAAALVQRLSSLTPPAPPITASIYRFWGFGLTKGIRFNLTMLMIILLQLSIPGAILYWCMQKTTGLRKSTWWYGLPSVEDGIDTAFWNEVPRRLIAVVSIDAFVVNGYVNAIADAEVWAKIKVLLCCMDGFIDLKTVYWKWLHLGPIINSYVTIVCSIDMFFLVHFADDEKDIVLYALALLFVQHLDTCASSLLSDNDWNSANLGAYYFRLQETIGQTRPNLFKEAKSRNSCHKLTLLMLTFLGLMLPALFVFYDLETGGPGQRGTVRFLLHHDVHHG